MGVFMSIFKCFNRLFYRNYADFRYFNANGEETRKKFAVIRSILRTERDLQIDLSTALEAAKCGELIHACQLLAEAEGRCANGR